jgi:tetratricopeptide (TPR) repeat protein
MKQNRNDLCQCGSGLKFKKCCGSLNQIKNAPKPPVPIQNILPLENSSSINNTSSFQSAVLKLLEKGNIPQADTYLRMMLESEPNNPPSLNFLGWISSALNLHKFAISYFEKAIEQDRNWGLPLENIQIINNYLKTETHDSYSSGIKNLEPSTPKYLLIKAWGHGFWSDVSHVLGQLLIAELTGRLPVVYWGENSLFGDGTDGNAFEYYFENFSTVDINQLQQGTLEYWPPKWNNKNLKSNEVNKWTGPYSRIAGQYLLNRPENVVVSDFYSGVIDLKPWIPSDHPLFGLSIDEIYHHLVNRYLNPKSLIKDKVDSFLRDNLMQSSFIAVHARGSDKILEMKNLDDVNRQYKSIIDKEILIDPEIKIFLMTDDSRILDEYLKIYGDRVVVTDCQRTGDSQGVHYKTSSNSVKLGFEVMTDVYIAAKAKVFIGNGFSNPSQIVRYLNNWSEDNLHYVGVEMFHSFNTFIHNW